MEILWCPLRGTIAHVVENLMRDNFRSEFSRRVTLIVNKLFLNDRRVNKIIGNFQMDNLFISPPSTSPFPFYFIQIFQMRFILLFVNPF